MEAAKVKVPRSVRAPTEKEREDHVASGHAVFRAWCRHCLAAKGRMSPHFAQDGQEGDIPEAGLDYGYRSNRKGKVLLMIVGKGRKIQCYCASFLPSKGAADYAASRLAGWLRGLAWKRQVVRSDNESPLLALLRAASASLPGVEVVEKTCPEGDSAANGLAEVAVREVKCQVRAVRSQLEERLGQRLDVKDPLYSWIPRHSANCINRYRVLNDGKTSERRRTGRQWKRQELEFGEVTMFRPVLPKAQPSSEDRMIQGVYVGHHERTGATLLLTPEGVRRGIRVQRLPETDRWNMDFIKTCRGCPWDAAPRARQLAQPALEDEEKEHGVAPTRRPRRRRTQL